MDISQSESEHIMKRLVREEGIFAGVSSGGAIAVALKLSAEVEEATIVAIIFDRGDRYLSTGVFASVDGWWRRFVRVDMLDEAQPRAGRGIENL